MTKEEALKVIDELQDRLCGISDAIWDNPELGNEEYFANKTYCEFLKEQGFEVEESVGALDTAFIASYGSGSPVIGILGEFDALANLSQEAELAECRPVTPGAPGHGCGHNLLGVGSLAAALAVKAYLESGHPGCVKFFGCPAEEGGFGKGYMAAGGAFDGVDLALTWHPGDVNNVYTGGTLANQCVYYHFKGKAAHAAVCPELGRSALDAVELMNVGVQFLREHVPSDSRIHYAITNTGGIAPAVVQATADVTYLMRAPQVAQVDDIRRRIDLIAQGAALMTETEVEIEFRKSCANTLPNRVLAEVLQRNMDALGGPVFDEADYALAEKMRKTMKKTDTYYAQLLKDVDDPEIREKLEEDLDAPLCPQVIPLQKTERCSQASSDVGEVSWMCPVGQCGTVTMPAGTPMHSWQQVAVGKSALAHKGMLQVGRIIAGAAIDILDDPVIAERAKAEHTRRTGGVHYVPKVPSYAPPIKQ